MCSDARGIIADTEFCHAYTSALRHAVRCSAVLCCAVLCCAVLCCAVLCCAVLRHLLCYSILVFEWYLRLLPRSV